MRKPNLHDLAIRKPVAGMICYRSYGAAHRALVCLRKNRLRGAAICRCLYCEFFHIGFEFIDKPARKKVAAKEKGGKSKHVKTA